MLFSTNARNFCLLLRIFLSQCRDEQRKSTCERILISAYFAAYTVMIFHMFAYHHHSDTMTSCVCTCMCVLWTVAYLYTNIYRKIYRCIISLHIHVHVCVFVWCVQFYRTYIHNNSRNFEVETSKQSFNSLKYTLHGKNFHFHFFC